MSQETVKRAREVLVALGTRDPSRLIALSDPEVDRPQKSTTANLVERWGRACGCRRRSTP